MYKSYKACSDSWPPVSQMQEAVPWYPNHLAPVGSDEFQLQHLLFTPKLTKKVKRAKQGMEQPELDTALSAGFFVGQLQFYCDIIIYLPISILSFINVLEQSGRKIRFSLEFISEDFVKYLVEKYLESEIMA